MEALQGLMWKAQLFTICANDLGKRLCRKSMLSHATGCNRGLRGNAELYQGDQVKLNEWEGTWSMEYNVEQNMVIKPGRTKIVR